MTEHVGARCPRCRCGHCPVKPPPRYMGKYTLRKRECRNCGTIFRTREETTRVDPPKPPAEFSDEK